MSLYSTFQRKAADVLEDIAEKAEGAATYADSRGGASSVKIEAIYGSAWEARQTANNLRKEAKERDAREEQRLAEDSGDSQLDEEDTDEDQDDSDTSSLLYSVYGRLIGILTEQLSIDPESIELDSSIVDDLYADSLDQVELVMALEEEFETEIPDEDAQQFITVRDVLEYLWRYLSDGH